MAGPSAPSGLRVVRPLLDAGSRLASTLLLVLVERLGVAEPLRAMAQGGLEVMSPEAASELDSVHFRTLIDWDGDVVTTVLAESQENLPALETHFRKVAKRVEEARRAIERLLGALAVALGGGIGTVIFVTGPAEGASAPQELGASILTSAALVHLARLAGPLRARFVQAALSWIAERVAGRAFGRSRLDAIQKEHAWIPTRVF